MSKTSNEVDGKKLIFDACDLIFEALKIKEDHWSVHKWASILLNSKTLYERFRSYRKPSLSFEKYY